MTEVARDKEASKSNSSKNLAIIAPVKGEPKQRKNKKNQRQNSSNKEKGSYKSRVNSHHRIWSYRSIVFRVFYCTALRIRATSELLLKFYLYDNSLRGRQVDISRFSRALRRCLRYDYVRKGKGRGLYLYMGSRKIRTTNKESKKYGNKSYKV